MCLCNTFKCSVFHIVSNIRTYKGISYIKFLDTVIYFLYCVIDLIYLDSPSALRKMYHLIRYHIYFDNLPDVCKNIPNIFFRLTSVLTTNIFLGKNRFEVTSTYINGWFFIILVVDTSENRLKSKFAKIIRIYF